MAMDNTIKGLVNQISGGFGKDFTLYKRLMGYLEPYKKRFIIGSLSSIPASGIEAGAAFLAGPFIDKLIKSERYDMLLLLPVALVVARILQSAFDYISTYYTSYVGTSISCDFRIQLFDNLIDREVSYYGKHSSGDLVSRFFNDPVRLQTSIVGNLQDFVKEFISLVFLAGVLIYRSWFFSVISIGVIALVGIPLAIISRKIRNLDHRSQEVSADLIRKFYDLLMGKKVIKIYNLTAYEKKRYRETLKGFFEVSMSLVKAGVFLKPATQLISSIGIGIVMWLGTMQLIAGKMTPGDLISFIVALILMYKPIKTLTGIIGKIQRILAPAERVFEKLDERPEIEDSEDARGIATFETLTFKDVWFEYEKDRPVLKNINLEIKAGQTIAFVGESGGGKSTLVNLIPRFLDPTQGEVLVNGISLKDIKMKSLYNHMAMVTQEPFLIDETLGENIKLGKLDATDKEVIEAAKFANIWDHIDSLPEKLDAPAGVLGANLSGGQKQRITIARAFLKNPPLLILDEATSALDNETERHVQESLLQLRQGRTVIVIAHRLSTIRFADCIHVVENGEMIESGNHDELMAVGGVYKRLYDLQFSKAGEDERATVMGKEVLA